MPKTKKEWLMAIYRTIIVIIGTFAVAFGSVGFLVPLDINAGGLSGIGIVVRHFVAADYKVLAYNIAVTVLAVVFWLIGLIFIGKDFAIKTLVATIVFPGANWLFTACPGVRDLMNELGELMSTTGNSGTPTAGNFLLSGIFGGVFIGVGVAITFVGGGSTGGVDVLSFLMEKYLKIRQSIASFVVDGTIIVVGLFCLVPSDKTLLLPCLSGIISAFVSALFIEFIYIGSQTSYQVDVISDKWEEISNYVQTEVGRGCTVIPAKGGFKGDERIVLRIVFNKREYNKIRAFIAKVDPKAFVTYTRTNAVFGEGFKPHKETTLFTDIKDKKENKDGKK